MFDQRTAFARGLVSVLQHLTLIKGVILIVVSDRHLVSDYAFKQVLCQVSTASFATAYHQQRRLSHNA